MTGSEPLGKAIMLGYFREPLAASLQTCRLIKRLPSRRWVLLNRRLSASICVHLRLLCLRGSDRHYPIRGQVLMTELAPQKLDRQGSISRGADSVRIVFDDRFSKARRFT
jgi:hypothetical protein